MSGLVGNPENKFSCDTAHNFLPYIFKEIYPPKLAEFAYVTDGACTEDEILDQELIMLKVILTKLNNFLSN